jgi:hypothetical protein
MEDYIIAVFTRGRVSEQFTIEALSPEIRRLITIVCHPGELKEHKRRWEGKVANIIEYGADCTYLGMARDWLMNYCRERNIKYAIQIDDNVYFAARSDGKSIDFAAKLKNIRNNFTQDEQTYIYSEMLFWMINVLRLGYGICGVSHRSGNNRKQTDMEENTRLFAVWGINVKKYFKVKAKFSDNPFKEDFHMQLAFLTHGIKTICNNSFTFDKARGANYKGGCSTYRNSSNVDQGAILLNKFYPDFATIVEKKNNNWSNMDGREVRKECIVHWKKAYESSIKQ